MDDQSPKRVKTDLVEFEFPDTLFGRLRRLVHGLAGKWPLRATIQQQNVINAGLSQEQTEIKSSVQQIGQGMVQQQKQIGELTALVSQLNRQLEELQSELDSKG